jgi:TfuA protein
MKNVIVFVGPSLDTEKARKRLEADYRPPAKKGDLIRLIMSLDDKETVVGLIDGYFLLDYPPTPIEVYQLIIRHNTVVIGSSSIGALRAVELERFGMIGVGKIFQLFKTGRLDADDEVAVTFSQDLYHLQSEAMVDIRYNLYLSLRKGFIDKETKYAITKVAKDIYFPFRTYHNIVEETIRRYPILDDKVRRFEAYIFKNRKSLKEKDALKLIEYIRDMI